MNFSELIQAVRRDPSSVVVRASWGQGRATFGGLVVALAYEAMLAVVEAGRPLRSIGVSFVGPLAPEQPASFSARLLREGKAVSQVQVEVRQGEQVVTLVQASFGVARASAVAVEALPAAGMKGPEESQELPYIRNVTPEFTRYIAMRWAVGGLPFSSNKSRQMGGWMRFRDEPEGEPMEVSHLLALLDSWPPALLPHLGTPAMASSLTWTAEFLQPLPQQGSGDWCRYLAEIEEARDGYGHVAARMWSADGQLLAISRQMVTVFG
ncbi:acyl-CoA thioesterase II [Pseudomonas aeruginosa]|uniref:acyl-CoA thioesterase n=1 Tax=Pseudomonas aeruginosa TaxID=287 RepID=UPI001F1EE57A|nr:acyl-CoA thioesterase II [Pseudomonas aeruginosa]UJC35254.1 acyl-CoA thioesterase II [Pseudomonas aeruginosa]